MARNLREHTFTGIYHVMLRGINKQNIFFSEDDYMLMMEILRDAPYKINQASGEILSHKLCTIYAYCILDNHVHILIREGEMGISDLMQSIELKYAKAYNLKYERVGHLFQGRFESETVDDSQYFYTLLRYIHRNPVKALEAKVPEEYPYSSWNEYTRNHSNIIEVLKPSAIEAVLRKYPLQELIEWVNTNADDKCLDMDRFPNPLSDREAFEILSEISGYENPEDFRLLDPPTQIYYLLKAVDRGITLRQASRLGTLSYYIIRKAYNKKRGDSSTAVPGTAVEENKEIPRTAVEVLRRAMQMVEENYQKQKEKKQLAQQNELLKQYKDRILHIEGLSKRTYHRLLLIAEFLSNHPASKCQEVADHIQASPERARILLVQLSNYNIVDIQGNARSRTYSLHSRSK